MSLSNHEVREALLKVFDGWVEQHAAMKAESAAMRTQVQPLTEQPLGLIGRLQANAE